MKLAGALMLGGSLLPLAAQTSPEATSLEERVIIGEEELTIQYDKTILSPELVSSPTFSSVVTADEIARMPVTTYGDLFQRSVGVDVVRYDQGGTGYGIAMRGFDSGGHGNSTAIFIDGMPLNDTGISNPGNADLNILIPEVLQDMTIVRGPWNPRYGNYNLGGSVTFRTFDYIPTSIKLSGGTYDTYRALGIYGFRGENVEGYSSVMGATAGGYRDNTGLDQFNTFNKIAFPMLGGRGSVSAQLYTSSGDSPGYIPRASVEDGTLSPRAAVNPTDGTTTEKQNVVFNYSRPNDNTELSGAAYFINSHFKRWSTFGTSQSLLDTGYQTVGGRLEHWSKFELANEMAFDFLVGAAVQADFADVERYGTDGRRNPTTTALNVDWTQINPGAYFQASFQPLRWLKLTAGGRYDHFFFEDVHNRPADPPATAPITSEYRFSTDTGGFRPRGGIAVTPVEGLSFFGNAGQGIRSPIVASTSELLTNPGLRASELTTYEVGVRYDSPNRIWYFQATAYTTDFDGEIAFDPILNISRNVGQSKRDGIDLEGRVRLFKNETAAVSFYAGLSLLDAKLIDPFPTATPRKYIVGAPDYMLTTGFDLDLTPWGDTAPHLITLSLYNQYVGPRPLASTDVAPPNFQESEAYHRLNGKIAYQHRQWHNLTAFVGVIAYPASRIDETAFGNSVSPKAPVHVEGGIAFTF